MKGWRKLGAFALVLVLAAFTPLEITMPVVILFAVLCGGNALEHLKGTV